METIRIQTRLKEYNVFVGEGVSKQISSFLSAHFPSLTRILIITDETVAAIHLDKLLSHLHKWNPVVFTTPSGESAKTFEVYYEALTAALENNLDRKSLMLSFGGGAVGDLSGFVASTFMRGIPFIQVPTTILAHDSAVGGKVAINHPLGKNMIGAFYQPEAVFYDLDYLKTLPLQEIRSGFSEVIKHALINDVDFYNWLQKNIRDFNSLTMETLAASITRGIKVKGGFVSQDERETGVRAYLNFGHTLGHAIESEMGYGNITHGEAVMIGMIFALKLSQELQELPFDVDHFIDWVKELGYETKPPTHLSTDRLLFKMKKDKKSIGETIRFVLLNQVGKPVLEEIPDRVLIDMLKNY
jgi:3-dehydroquinate synthase